MAYPSTFSGVGTLVEAGRWSTNSVTKNGSVVYWRILAVYPSSFLCGAAAGTGALAGFLPAAESVRAIKRQIAVLRMISIITQKQGSGAAGPGVRPDYALGRAR